MKQLEFQRLVKIVADLEKIKKLLADDKAKAPYLAKAEKEKEKYTQAMAAYKAKSSA